MAKDEDAPQRSQSSHLDRNVRIGIQRIFEAIVIAVLTSAFTSYIQMRIIEDRVAVLGARMDRVESAAQSRYDGLQRDLQQIYVLIAQLRVGGGTNR